MEKYGDIHPKRTPPEFDGVKMGTLEEMSVDLAARLAADVKVRCTTQKVTSAEKPPVDGE